MLFPGSPQRYPLIQSHIIPDNRRFPDNHTISVINKKPPANLRSRMDFNPRFPDPPLRNPPGQKKMARSIQLMSQPVMKHDLKAGIKKYLHRRMYCRVTLPDNPNLLFYVSYNTHLPSFFPGQQINRGSFPSLQQRRLKPRFHSNSG